MEHCRGFLPVILGKGEVKIVPGYIKVISHVILAEKSAGVHFFFLVYIKMQEHFSVGPGYTLLIIGSQECRGTLFQCIFK